MKIEGVIFDFNGTLFWDTEFHNKAWDIYLERFGMKISDHEKDVHFHGKPSKDIFEFIFKREMSRAELSKAVEEKESIYRGICVKNNGSLAPGALGLLEFLKNNQVPFTIATSSEITNVRFFFEFFKLDKWFSLEKVVCDDGSFNGKPAPDIFLLAAQKINVPVNKCLIFEDSVAGLKAAANAMAGMVVYVRSNKIEVSENVYQAITDFNQVDRRVFSD